MTYSESKPLAKKLAEQSLNKGFDKDAFLVMGLLELLGYKEVPDDIPDTQVDNFIVELMSLFTTYYNNKTIETLRPLLSTISQILSELYHDCECDLCREQFKIFFGTCPDII